MVVGRWPKGIRRPMARLGLTEIGRWITSSLRTRILLWTLAAFLAVSIPATFAFNGIVNATVNQLGTLFAEKQILFDRERGLGVLTQEVKLAETLARSPVIREWALNEDDPGSRSRGIAELEHYREAFVDRSYFFVVDASLNYYFNDAANSFANRQLSHKLSRENPRDAWYFTTVALGDGCHLNVDHDDVLRVTKVWFNCVVREGSKVVGVIGSGIDLSAFVREVVDIPQPGVVPMFVDGDGALQAHRDLDLIDFHSFTKEPGQHRTIFSLLEREEDRAELKDMMRAVTSGEILVRSVLMEVDGRPVLVGVGYLAELGWYNVTFMDLDKIIDRSLFVPIGLLLLAIMLSGALLIAFVFKRVVLDRLALVESRFAAVKDGSFVPVPTDLSRDEIGRLSRAFTSMAATVSTNTQMLEELVAQRTAELQALANLDQLTNIANRRGFMEAFARVQQKADAAGYSLGLMLIDVDGFKGINDSFGHQAGDHVVVEIARRLTGVVRRTDVCGRWGGDEFIVLINDIGTKGLKTIAEAVKQAVAASPITLGDARRVSLTVSIGACLVAHGESVEAVADLADAALYHAKDTGRDRVVVFDAADTKDRRRSA
jgi:diguanylate cyclase (GGDEF)-like protein